MSISLVIPIVMLVIFISSALRSAFGFGNALIAMPLLILLAGPKSAAPLVALAGIITALVILSRNWQRVEIRDMTYLLLTSLAGVPIGVFLLLYLPENLIKAILGAVLIGFGILCLAGIKLPTIKASWLAFPTGFFAGILAGAYNANGPPIVLYGILKGWEKEKFRATLQGYFLVTGLLVAASHGLGGLWTGWVIIHLVLSIPMIFLGVLAGERITARISSQQFNQALYAVLIVLGILMFI